ncbi:MAG: succinylglutamate desuccinylase/aspartoacylase family protein [Candidatus Brockarchaeota archaeon]|nr:succinylglutamate desuccinylase/aspartoacylase family protein [Candidatus Brockarchaeota archaeon]
MPGGKVQKLPFIAVRGAGDGPTYYVQAAQHGIELTGTETTRRLALSLNPKELSGSLIAVPVANPLAVRCRMPFYGMREGEPYSMDHPHQMNTLWPGDPRGNETERIAHALHQNLVWRADFVIDLHCHVRWKSKLAISCSWDKRSVEIARYLGLMFVRREPKSAFRGRMRGMLHYVATKEGRAAVAVEHSGMRWIWGDQAKVVARGIMNVMRLHGALPGEPVEPGEQYLYLEDRHVDIESDLEGLIVTDKGPEERVSRGEGIMEIIDLGTLKSTPIRSPIDGVVYELAIMTPNPDTKFSDTMPLATRGCKLASVYRAKKANRINRVGSTHPFTIAQDASRKPKRKP